MELLGDWLQNSNKMAAQMVISDFCSHKIGLIYQTGYKQIYSEIFPRWIFTGNACIICENPVSEEKYVHPFFFFVRLQIGRLACEPELIDFKPYNCCELLHMIYIYYNCTYTDLMKMM